MAFLLAAAMVVGSAATASAVNLNLNILGVDADRVTAKGQKFALNNGFDFKSTTAVNEYTAAWANQTDATSKAIYEAWQNGQKVYNMTAMEQEWATQGAYQFDKNLADTLNVYGQWVNGAWDKTADQAANMTSIGYNDIAKNMSEVFATTSAGKAVFRSGYGVILKSTVVDIIREFAAADAETNALKKATKFNAVIAKLSESGLIKNDVAWVDMDTTDEIIAFVNMNGKTKTYQPLEQGVITSAYTSWSVREMKNTDGMYDAVMMFNDNCYYYYDVVSPLEALYTYNEWSTLNANKWYTAYNGQQYDLYEVIVGKKSIDDPNFGYLNAGQSADPKVDKVRLWKWNNQFAKQTWIERNAAYKAANTIVEQSWKDAVSPKMIEAYNAAAEKAGLAALNDDAKVGDIYYLDIAKTSGDASNKYTLLYGTVAKTLTDKAKAVKVLHWTNGAWKAVPAEAVRLYNNEGDNSYGVLIEENTYSPFIVIEIENEGTGADATADAAKTPEKSGKTGVSFLGL